MLKKAGIVVAAATVSLLALSPLAFASDDDSVSNNNGSSSVGLLNASDDNGVLAAQLCNNDVPIQGGAAQVQTPVKDLTGAASGALALFGKAFSGVDQATDNSRACGDNEGAAGDSSDQDAG